MVVCQWSRDVVGYEDYNVIVVFCLSSWLLESFVSNLVPRSLVASLTRDLGTRLFCEVPVTSDYDSTAISNDFAPYKGIQDSLGFWTPRRGFRIPGLDSSLFQWNLSVIVNNRTRLTRTIIFHLLMTWFLGSNRSLCFFFLCVLYNLTY